MIWAYSWWRRRPLSSTTSIFTARTSPPISFDGSSPAAIALGVGVSVIPLLADDLVLNSSHRSHGGGGLQLCCSVETKQRHNVKEISPSLLLYLLLVKLSNMVSELAGEGAIPPQLPAPASRSLETAVLRFHLRKQIRRGSLLPRGVNLTKTIALFSPSFNRSRSLKFLSKVLNNPMFEVFYRSRSVKSSSRVLDPPTVAIRVHGADPWNERVQCSLISLASLVHSTISSCSAIHIQSLSKVLISSLFTIFTRSRSVKSSSAELVVIVSSPQRRTREKKQLLTLVRDFASEKSQGERRISNLKNRIGDFRSSESLSVVLMNPPCVISLVNTTVSKNREGSIANVFGRVLEEEFSENDQPESSEKSSFNSSVADHEAVLENGGEELKGSKLSGIIIPGFAPLDLVWLDTTKLLSDVYCRLMCMLLNPYNQTNHPECKSHPDSGFSAIAKLDPGYIIAQLSSVWKEWIKWCIEFGVDAHAITAVQYDWRLQPSKLEERDLYFHKLKLSLLTFETSLKHHGGQQIVFAHSLGFEDLGGMVELVEGSVVDLDGIDVTKVGVAVYAEFCRDWGEALRLYDGAYHVLREMATSWCTDKMESSLIAMLKVVGLVAVVVKSLIDVFFSLMQRNRQHQNVSRGYHKAFECSS
nr:phospholipid--sterol O-acyltransferase isoform X2 [Ipomoea batatas]